MTAVGVRAASWARTGDLDLWRVLLLLEVPARPSEPPANSEVVENFTSACRGCIEVSPGSNRGFTVAGEAASGELAELGICMAQSSLHFLG